MQSGPLYRRCQDIDLPAKKATIKYLRFYPRRSIGSRTLGRSGDLPVDFPVDLRPCCAELL